MKLDIVRGCITLHIRVISDHVQKGHPNADSDWDFLGYRETEWELESASITWQDCSSEDMSKDVVDMLVNTQHNEITQMIQNELDIVNGR